MENEPLEYNWYKVYGGEGIGNQFVKPGKIRSAIVNDQKLCFVKRQERIFAFLPKCPHNGASLENGFFNERGDVVCPLHRFAFCVETGKNTSGEGYYLANFPVEVRNGDVYVGFPKPPRSKKRGWFG